MYGKKSFKKTFRRQRKVLKRMYTKRNYKATSKSLSFLAPRQQPLPSRYRTKFTSNITASIDAGATSYQLLAYHNYFEYPWSINVNAGEIAKISNLQPSLGYPTESAILAALQPAALANIFEMNSDSYGKLYQNYRTYASKISLTVMPQALADTMQVTITPVSEIGDPSVSLPQPQTCGDALASPFTKRAVFSAGKGISTLSNYISTSKLFGIKSRAVQDATDNDLFYNSGWVVNFSTMDATNTATPVLFEVKMTYYVELYQNNNDQMNIGVPYVAP